MGSIYLSEDFPLLDLFLEGPIAFSWYYFLGELIASLVCVI